MQSGESWSQGGEEECENAGCTHRVPNLQLDLLVIDSDHPGTELNTDGQIVNLLKPFVCELQQQARLSHACIADDDVPAAKSWRLRVEGWRVEEIGVGGGGDGGMVDGGGGVWGGAG